MEAIKILNQVYKDYQSDTPTSLKLVDAYLLFTVLTGVPQFLYCLIVGTFPFNAFLSGFASTVGSFILGACLRIQVNKQNRKEFEAISIERAFADFIFGHLVLHLVVMNFLG